MKMQTSTYPLLLLLYTHKLFCWSIPVPVGVFNDFLQTETLQQMMVAEKNPMIDKDCEKILTKVRQKISSPDGELVAIKFTLENEVGTFGIKEIKLSEDLKNHASLFVVDYRLFLDFLHLQVYKKAKIKNLEIPSLLFFRYGKLQFPIETCDGLINASNLDSIEELIRKKLNPEKLNQTQLQSSNLF